MTGGVVGRLLGAAPTEGTRTTIDWLELSVKDLEALQLASILRDVVGPGFGPKALEVERDDEKRFLATGPHGMRVLADPVGQENRDGNRQPWAGVKLPGKACRAAGTAKLLQLLQVLDEQHELKVSRIDVALDDFSRTFTPRQFAEACVAGDLSSESAKLSAGVITRVRPENWNWSRSKNGCFWLGGAKAARRLRVYDKEAESAGAIPAVRIELQSRDAYALAMARRLVAADEASKPLTEVMLAHLVAFVDLRIPVGRRSSSQHWPRVEWWAKLVGNVGPATVPREDPSDAQTWRAQCCRQFAGFLGVMLRLAGVSSDDLRRLVGPDEIGPANCLARMVSEVLGGPRLPKMTPEHEERLRLLELARTVKVGP